MEDLFLMSSSVLIVEYLLFALLARMLILAKHVTCQFTLVPPLADRKQVQRGEMTSLKGIELDATLGSDLSI